MSHSTIRLGAALVAALLSAAIVASPPVPPSAPTSTSDLYAGWLKMYDLKFEEAHRVFQQWKQTHPADVLGSASDAAAYLFAELARLGVLESELFTDDSHFLNRTALRPDQQVKTEFDREIATTDRLADSSLQANPTDTNALFAKSLSFGLRADSASLIEKREITALKFTKAGRTYGDKLIMIDPSAYDAYLGSGVENYLLSLKPAPLRMMLRLTGSMVDKDKGVKQLRMTAQYGHYLEPFAKLLLAVAAVRDNNAATARSLLEELHNRFPDNQLYVRELNRLK